MESTKALMCFFIAVSFVFLSTLASASAPGTRALPKDPATDDETLVDFEKKPLVKNHWSSWSEWSPCSRTCDGGAAYQTRHCLNTRAGCSGENIRYKICNMQPCTDPMDFRLHQCQGFDSVPYQGKLYSWVPHFEPTSPCALYCKAINHSLVVQLAPRVHDGTRCKGGSLDMCIQGICQPVGCDLQLGSDMKIDACGVCGGDGTSCADPIYLWQYGSQLGECSATCDGGQQEILPVCIHSLTGEKVPDGFCQEATRLKPKYLPCNEDPCPPTWITEPWSACSASCGGGLRRRRVYCAHAKNQTLVEDSLCYANGGVEPRGQEPCNIFDCPQWFEGAWSECSVTCGYGLQTRPVVCRDARGHVTDTCDPVTKPETTQPCFDLECPSTTPRASTTTPPSRLPRQKVTPFSLFDDEDDEDDQESVKAEQDLRKAKETTGSKEVVQVPSLPQPSALLSEKFVIDERSIVPTDPTFIVGDWSPCSVTCGEGVRKREVNCKIFLEFSRTIAKLPDKECPGPKPTETEPCFKTPCSLSNKFEPWIAEISDQSNKLENNELKNAGRTGHDPTRTAHRMEHSSNKTPHASYTWKMSGFTQCSASCLGGVQESIIECIRDHDGQRVSPYLCPLDKRPDSITRTCNDVPCPPRWNISDYTPCSKPCGGGIQTREVHCIHEIARGGANTLPVTSNLCPQPPPRAEQYCNMIDCPVEWNIGEWTKCSATCGGGHKTRKITCQQVLALGQIVTKAAHLCIDPKPTESKACNPKPCESSKGRILVSNQTFIQTIPKRKVTLKIGGTATVLKGTQVRIRCPVKHFDKSKVIWMKEHHILHKTSKYDTSKKGVLQILDVTYSDNGIYSCVAGSNSANISLTVRPPLEDNRIVTDTEENLQTNVKTAANPNNAETKGKHGKAGRVGGRRNGTRNGLKPGGKLKPSSKVRVDAPAGEKWPSLPDDSEDFEKEDEDETNGNSLDSKAGRLPFDLKQGKPRPLGTWDRLPDDSEEGDFTGPLYSDQEQLLWPFQDNNHRSDSIAKEPGFVKVTASRQKIKNSAAGYRPPKKQQTKIEFGTSSDEAPGSTVILGKGKAENLKFEWLMTPWSQCSQTCGGTGFQVRAAQCIVRLNNVTKSVEGSLCEDAGLQAPSSMQRCGLDLCPHWEAGPWTSCEDSRCFTWNTALQKRDVFCRLENGTELDPILCNEQDKPSQKRECFNENCRGTWKVGDWSEAASVRTLRRTAA